MGKSLQCQPTVEGKLLTGGVCELILLPLDPVLQRLSLATRLLNARLHRLGRYIIRSLRVHRRTIEDGRNPCRVEGWTMGGGWIGGSGRRFGGRFWTNWRDPRSSLRRWGGGETGGGFRWAPQGTPTSAGRAASSRRVGQGQGDDWERGVRSSSADQSKSSRREMMVAGGPMDCGGAGPGRTVGGAAWCVRRVGAGGGAELQNGGGRNDAIGLVVDPSSRRFRDL